MVLEEREKIIAGYKVNLDLNKIGYSKYRLFLELDDSRAIDELIKYCEVKDFIVGITTAIGNNIDFRVNLEIDKLIDMPDLIRDLKKKFLGKIRDYKYVRFVEEYKK